MSVVLQVELGFLLDSRQMQFLFYAAGYRGIRQPTFLPALAVGGNLWQEGTCHRCLNLGKDILKILTDRLFQFVIPNIELSSYKSLFLAYLSL